MFSHCARSFATECKSRNGSRARGFDLACQLAMDRPLRVPWERRLGSDGDFMTTFSLQTLGFPEIRADDRPIKLNLRKGLALLIYLAETQGAVARDAMATLLWPDSPAETARTRLRRMLHRLELALGQ